MMEDSRYPESQQIEPMKYCSKVSEEQALKSWESGEWLAQEKKDGALYQLEKTDSGFIYLFGRTKSKVTGEYTEKSANVPHIVEWAEQYLPNGTTLIGEIYVPGGKSNDVTKIMGCTPENAHKRQFESDAYGGPIHYYVFDIIRYRGEDLCNKGTFDRIEHYLHHELIEIFNKNKYIELAWTYYDNFETHLKNIFAAGGEGMVFKNYSCPYRPGKRSTVSQMYKWKEHLDSLDLVCMELLDPVKEYTGKEVETWSYWAGARFISDYPDHGSYEINSQLMFNHKPVKEELPVGYMAVPITKPYYYGWKNAMRLGAYKNGELVEVCRVASGLTDVLREDMAKQPEAYIGRVIEIECMSVNKKDGTVRHPVFLTVRFDKDAKDCKWDEIFD